MRKLTKGLSTGALLWLVAAQAQAAALPFSGSLALQIATLTPVVMLGAGTAIVNGSGGSGHLTQLTVPASSFSATNLVVPVSDPAQFPIVGVQVTAHAGTGVFGGSGGLAFGGALPMVGVAKICLLVSCGSFPPSNLSVPLSVVGQGGYAFVTGFVNVTVGGAPWTTGTVAVGTMTAMGGVAPLSNTGAPSGVVTLVTPIFISTNVTTGGVVPAFGILSLHFVPEPGTLVLLGSGIVGLVAYGRSRPRS